MRALFGLAVILTLLTACDKKEDRVCSCTVTDKGTVFTETEISMAVIPLFPPIVTSDTSSAPYESQTSAKYNYSKVREKDMNAACPRSSSEEVNEKLVTKSDSVISITITSHKVGTRTKNCTIQ